MSILHFKSITIADGTNSDIVRPSDWLSVHNQVLNMGGNTAGTAQISGADIVWAGGNNVTLSANGSTVSIIGPTVPAQTVQTQASGNIVGAGFTTTTVAGAVVAATQNSAGLLMAVPGYLTTARASNDAVGLNSALTANGVSWTVNSSGISLNVPAFLTTAAQSNHSHNFATTTTNGSVAVVATTNSEGATVAMPAWITTYAAQTNQTVASGNIAGVGTTLALTNATATLGVNSAGVALSLSVGAGGVINQTGPNIAVAGSTVTSGAVYFSNSPTVTFGMAGSTITASAAGGGGGGATLVEFEPVMFISSYASTMPQNTLYVNTLIVPNNLAANYMLMPVAFTAGWTSSTPVTNSTATTSSSGSASAQQSFNFYLFTDGTGGMESNIYTALTNRLTGSTNISWAQSNSNTTTGTQTLGSSVGFTYGYPSVTSGTLTSISTNSTVTTWGTTTASSTNSSTSTGSVWPGGTNNAVWTGSRLMYMPVGSTLTPGEYWVGMMRSSATVGAAVAGTYSVVQQSFTTFDTNARYGPFGFATTQVNYMPHPAGIVNGVFSTTYNSTSNYAGAMGSAGAIVKSHVNMASVTNTTGTLSRFYNRFMQEVF